MTILCSKSQKTGVLKAKSAQKPRFCARKARKWGSRRQKAHKNHDFVLEKPENEGSEGQKSTKTPILCSKSPKMRVSKAKSAQKPRFCARNAQKWGFRRQKKHKNLVFVLGKVDRRAWVQQQANANSIGKRRSSCGPPKRSIGKSKCAQICLFLKLVR